MARVKRGVESRRKHKKVLKLAKGFRGARSRTYKVAKQAEQASGKNTAKAPIKGPNVKPDFTTKRSSK